MVLRVLLVDDHPILRLGVSSLLEAHGIEVAGEAGDAEEASRLLEDTELDLVLLDVRLPGKKGAELCREIKSRPDPPRVLVYTAHNMQEEVSSLVLAGADSYLHKGVKAADLPEIIRRTCAGERVWILGPENGDLDSDLITLPEEARLTNREKEIYSLMRLRYSNAEISKLLHITLPTVKSHVSNITKKTADHNSKETPRGPRVARRRRYFN